ncbi:hypothetical protein TNCV_1022721, partial [Trichonephila clavipes]
RTIKVVMLASRRADWLSQSLRKCPGSCGDLLSRRRAEWVLRIGSWAGDN